MIQKKVAVIDYGINNISSILKAFNQIDIKSDPICESNKLDDYKYIILPGVGSFDRGIENLENKGFREKILELRNKGHFFLGICLGMQLLLEQSEESFDGLEGLTFFKGKCKKINLLKSSALKIPHIGWNNIKIKKKNKLTQNMPDNFYGYFVHSFFTDLENKEQILATSIHGNKFPSIIQSNNVFGTQFHPEKCQLNGLKIFKNFINLD